MIQLGASNDTVWPEQSEKGNIEEVRVGESVCNLHPQCPDSCAVCRPSVTSRAMGTSLCFAEHSTPTPLHKAWHTV